jgi:glycosyltransferase involved in cell wall biosynthesis
MAGIPVVATSVGSVSEVVLDGITGIITNRNIQEIADALEKLAGNRALSIGMGAAAEKFTLANFGVNRLVLDHEVLYKKLMSSRTKS